MYAHVSLLCSKFASQKSPPNGSFYLKNLNIFGIF